MSAIAENIFRLREDLDRLRPEGAPLRLIAVSKTRRVEEMKQAVAAGIRDLGENRIQDAEEKFSQASFDGVERHFIGSIQSNKIRKMLGIFHWFHGLSSYPAARLINDEKSDIRCLIQVNISGEATKHGLSPEEVPAFVESLASFESLRICGLMTIGPHTTDRLAIRQAFHDLARLRKQLESFAGGHIQFNELSMGMSGDYALAIQEGATMVRIGTAIFGARA